MRLSVLILALFVLVIPASFAQMQITFLKENYIPGEVLQAKLNVLESPINEIDSTNIKLFDQAGEEIKLGFILLELGKNEYFIYSALPENLLAGVYNLSIIDLYYRPNNILTKTEITTNFEIISGGDLVTVSPPFFKIDPTDLPPEFTIRIKNLDTKTIEIQPSSNKSYLYPIRSSLTLEPGEQKNLFLRTNELLFNQEDAILNLTYNRYYQIPFYVISEAIAQPTISPTTTPTPTQKQGLVFATGLSEIVTTIYADEFIENVLPIKNELNQTLTNIMVSTTGNLNEVLVPNKDVIDSLEPLKTELLILSLNQYSNITPKTYEGELVIESGVYKDTLPMIITVEPVTQVSPTPTPTKEPSPSPTYTPTATLSPTPEEPIQREFPLIPVIVLIAVVLALILIFYSISKQGKKPKTFKEVIKSRKRL